MPDVIVLRTNHYDHHVDRMVRGLQAAARRRIVAVVDERSGSVNIPDDMTRIALDAGSRGLFVTADYGWRCGDYALYEAARAVPDASAYWLIEPDVRIHSSHAGDFFDGSEATRDADFVTAWFVAAGRQWQWYGTMEPFAERQYSAMMQLCRVSRPAALHLLRERRLLSERFRLEGRAPETWPNDEAFVGATLVKSGFRVATFQEHAPHFATEGSFTFTRPTSARWLESCPPDDRIYHPVVQGQKFRARLEAYLRDAGRNTGASGRPIDAILQAQIDAEAAPEPDPPPRMASTANAPLSTAATAEPITRSLPIHAPPAGPPVPVRFWHRIRNNGDALTAILVSHIFGGKPFQARPTDPHLIGVGSILFMANRHSVVWGSGVLNKVAYLPPIGGRQVRALRGRNSADYMREQGIALGEVAFGDPGILVDRLLPDALRNAAPKYRIAVVPHHDSVSHPFFAALRARDDVCVVDILDDTLLPIEQIAQSEIVLSQSLHGLVYAESLGKPSLWIGTRSDDVWTYKFKDWFTTTANPQRQPAPLEQGLERLADSAEPRLSTIDRESLIESFPRDLVLGADHGKLDYVACRALCPAMVFIPKAYDGKPGFVPARDAPLLSALSPVLVSTANALFAGWAERTYIVAVMTGSAAVPRPDQARVIVAALDARSGVDFAFVIRKPQKLPPGAREIELGAGVTLYAEYKALGTVLVIRPSFEALTETFVVFGI